MKKKLGQILSETDYLSLSGERDRSITGITHDSRSVKPGNAFVAVDGARADGHDFIGKALENGARAVFGEKSRSQLSVKPDTYVRVADSREFLSRISHIFYGKPTEDLYVVGITGTNGKTTTAHFTNLILGESDSGIISTITNKDSPDAEGPVTTPEAPEINRMANETRKTGRRNLILEVSSHSLSLKRVSSVEFDCGVFTNLTRDHLDYHESMEEYGKEKLKLFKALSEEDTGILNSDDGFSETIADVTRAEVIKYGLEGSPDVFAAEISQSRREIHFTLHSPWGKARVELGFPGRYNVYNALAAATVGLVNGKELESVVADLSRAGELPGRMERIELNTGNDVYVDFAHNPGALERALKDLKRIYESVFVVFGCGGESDRGKRPEMGKIASELADSAFITDDNPKKEDRMKILEEIESGITTKDNYEIIPDRKEAIEAALEKITGEGCLLIAGKGHEQHQIVSGEWLDYSDADFVKKLAREKSLL